MKRHTGTQLRLALVNVCQDGGRETNEGSRSRAQTPDRERARVSGEDLTRTTAIDAGEAGRVDLRNQARDILIDALASKDDDVARFAHNVIRFLAGG